MKKLISLLLALMMVLSLATVAFASEEGGGEAPGTPINPNATIVSGTFGTDTGSITINRYNADNDYILYRMLDLETFSTAGEGSYAYKINDDWVDFFKKPEVQDYVTVDNNYVMKKNTFTDTQAPAFAQLAIDYAKEKGLTPVANSNKAAPNGSAIIEGENVPCYTFDKLDLGYYLVDSTMGALCGLTTTNLNASINAKNGEPTLDKSVLEDSSGQWGINNTASIGDTIQYRATITVEAGAQDYIFHDKMSKGLTFDPATGVTEIKFDNATVDPSKYAVHICTTDCAGDEDTPACPCYDPNNPCTCTFHIIFDSAYCKTLAPGKFLVIFYKATLNKDAVIAGDGETNTAYLEFGEDHFTKHKTVTTHTYAFDLVKTDGQNFLLDGASFSMHTLKEGKLETDEDAYDLIQVVLVTDTKNNDDPSDDVSYYRPAVADDTNGVTEFAVTDGVIRFQGFDPGDYYFKETVVPKGYNQLSGMAKHTLGSKNKDIIINVNGSYSAGSGFQIKNQSGAMMPETGATGTALFIGFGMFVMLSTGVLLVTKKRMSMIEE